MVNGMYVANEGTLPGVDNAVIVEIFTGQRPDIAFAEYIWVHITDMLQTDTTEYSRIQALKELCVVVQHTLKSSYHGLLFLDSKQLRDGSSHDFTDQISIAGR